MMKNQSKMRLLPGKPLKMDEILKNVIFHGPHMPGIDLNPLRENMEQILKTDLVQPTPTKFFSRYFLEYFDLRFLLAS